VLGPDIHNKSLSEPARVIGAGDGSYPHAAGSSDLLLYWYAIYNFGV
jgi:hypothetical protein